LLQKSPTQNKTQIFAEKAKSLCVLFCSPSTAQKAFLPPIMKKEKFPMNVTLYSKPKELNNYIIEFKDWTPSFVTIDKRDEDWVLITIIYKDKRRTGWVKYDRLCANNYSTCS